MVVINCIFCASPCSTKVSIIDGKVTRVKLNEEFITADNFDCSINNGANTDPLSFKEEAPLVGEHLRAIFILKNVLKIRKERLYQFLRVDDGNSRLESLVNVCVQCEESVAQYWTTHVEIASLEKKLVTIEGALKVKIYNSTNLDAGPAPGAKGCLSSWSQIRSEVLINETDISFYNITKLRKFKCHCTQCPFRCKDGRHFRNHLKAHDPGSGGTPCPECGWYMLPSNLSRHMKNRHNRDWEPPPKKTDYPKGGHYKCKMCPYTTKTKKKFHNHVKLHEKGSGAIICSIEGCGWALPPTKLFWHNNSHHRPALRPKTGEKVMGKPLSSTTTTFECRHCSFSTVNGKELTTHLNTHDDPDSQPSPKKKRTESIIVESTAIHKDSLHNPVKKKKMPRNKKEKLVYFKCPDCNALSTTLREYRQHEKLHEEGEGQVCKKCKWLCKSVPRHEDGWHPPPPVKSRAEMFPRPIKLMEKGKRLEGEDENDDDDDEQEQRQRQPAWKPIVFQHTKKKFLGTRVREPIYCKECGFFTTNTKVGYFQAHRMVHGEGCGGFPCEDCGWYIFPEKVVMHRGHRHKEDKIEVAEGEKELLGDDSSDSDSQEGEQWETKIIDVSGIEGVDHDN